MFHVRYFGSTLKYHGLFETLYLHEYFEIVEYSNESDLGWYEQIVIRSTQIVKSWNGNWLYEMPYFRAKKCENYEYEMKLRKWSIRKMMLVYIWSWNSGAKGKRMTWKRNNEWTVLHSRRNGRNVFCWKVWKMYLACNRPHIIARQWWVRSCFA